MLKLFCVNIMCINIKWQLSLPLIKKILDNPQFNFYLKSTYNAVAYDAHPLLTHGISVSNVDDDAAVPGDVASFVDGDALMDDYHQHGIALNDFCLAL